jgi:type IV secretory pathway VirD2 relaxase
MIDDGDDFKPRLGRMRATRAKKGARYLGRILAAATLAGQRTGKRSARFDGSRIGRGAPVGRLLSARRAGDWRGARRVIVKTRLVRLGGRGLAAARAHLKYIERDGVTREGAPGELYAAREDVADGGKFLERCRDDRHQFRFIVSAEEGDLMADLKPFVRRLLAQMEEDFGTRLDWVAVDHFNTGHPHSHIMLRGVDDRGQNLVIAREYLAHGMRGRASDIATRDLGPKTRLEIETRMRRDVGAERLTDIDRHLLREAAEGPLVRAADRDPFVQSVRAGRLQKLGALGLAEEVAPGQWSLDPALGETLKHMGARGDIIAAMNRELAARGLAAAPADRIVHDEAAPLVQPLVGRAAMRGLADEIADRHYLIVDGVDGRTHYVGIGKGDAVAPLPEQAIVRIEPAIAAAREADRTVAAVAAANGGRYDLAAHLRYDPAASAAFAETHVRRLEAMRRRGALVERDAGGSWKIAPDHVARAEAYERDMLRDRPVTVEILSAVPVEKLPRVGAITWLDREAQASAAGPIRDKGFGREVRTAMQARRQWLVEQELADVEEGALRYRAGALAALQRRELLRIAGQLSRELGKPFAEAEHGERVDGKLARRIDGTGGHYAVVEKAKQFTLVPWKPVFERHIGKEVSGRVRDGGISWTIGRGREGPEIS